MSMQRSAHLGGGVSQQFAFKLHLEHSIVLRLDANFILNI